MNGTQSTTSYQFKAHLQTYLKHCVAEINLVDHLACSKPKHKINIVFVLFCFEYIQSYQSPFVVLL